MSADLFAAFSDSSFQPEASKSTTQPPTGTPGDRHAFLAPGTVAPRPSQAHLPQFSPGSTQYSETVSRGVTTPDWETMFHPQPRQSTHHSDASAGLGPSQTGASREAAAGRNDGDDEDDGWGDFEVAAEAIPQTSFAPTISNQTTPPPITSVSRITMRPVSRPEPPSRTRVIRASTLDIFLNRLMDLDRPSLEADSRDESPDEHAAADAAKEIQQQTEPNASDPDVVFDADDYDGTYSEWVDDDDDFGDFESVDDIFTTPIAPASVPVQSAMDLLSDLDTGFTAEMFKPPSQLFANLGFQDKAPSYPQVPRSRSFRERTPSSEQLGSAGFANTATQGLSSSMPPWVSSPVNSGVSGAQDNSKTDLLEDEWPTPTRSVTYDKTPPPTQWSFEAWDKSTTQSVTSSKKSPPATMEAWDKSPTQSVALNRKSLLATMEASDESPTLMQILALDKKSPPATMEAIMDAWDNCTAQPATANKISPLVWSFGDRDDSSTQSVTSNKGSSLATIEASDESPTLTQILALNKKPPPATMEAIMDAWDTSTTQPATSNRKSPPVWSFGVRDNSADSAKSVTARPRQGPSQEDGGPPPTNVPPPAILLSLFPELLNLANSSLLKPISGQPTSLKERILSDPKTMVFLRGYLALATVAERIMAGRKLRWQRDKFLSQGMAISSARGKGGMKLSGIDKAQASREDREAAEVVAVWRENVGRLRSAAAIVNRAAEDVEPLRIPELSENPAVRTALMVPTAPKPCAVCGLRRDERVDRVDIAVEDSFGEWWVEHWGHRDCRNFWLEHEVKLRQR